MQATDYLETPKFTYVNGKFVPSFDASLNVNDRGLKFGDGVYETIRVQNGKPVIFHKHFERLKISLQLLAIKADIADIENLCDALLAKNQIVTGSLRIMVTRGMGSSGYLPLQNNEFGIIIEANPLPTNIPKEPIDLWLSTFRKIPKECLPAAAKTMQGLSSTLARMEAETNNCFESILLTTDDKIAECSSSNIFWIKDDLLYTPSLATGILAGTTRDTIIEIIPDKVVEGEFNLDALLNADAVFVTNVIWLILPVKKLLPHNINYKEHPIVNYLRNQL